MRFRSRVEDLPQELRTGSVWCSLRWNTYKRKLNDGAPNKAPAVLRDLFRRGRDPFLWLRFWPVRLAHSSEPDWQPSVFIRWQKESQRMPPGRSSFSRLLNEHQENSGFMSQFRAVFRSAQIAPAAGGRHLVDQSAALVGTDRLPGRTEMIVWRAPQRNARATIRRLIDASRFATGALFTVAHRGLDRN